MTSQTRTALKGKLENGDVFDATIAGDMVDSSINLADSAKLAASPASCHSQRTCGQIQIK